MQNQSPPLQVDLYSSFRPGDIVRAAVLALGDSQSYILTTARNELGVVQAKGPAGEAWCPAVESPLPVKGSVLQAARRLEAVKATL